MRLLLKIVIRYLLPFALLGVVLYAAVNFRLVQYGFAQLKGQAKIILGARDIDVVLGDPGFPDSLKGKLLLIGAIRRFATDSLGLEDSRNYTSVYDQKGKPVLWVLTACMPFAMKAHEWEFPFLGAVPYKGFFEMERGLPEKQALEKQGYDTDYHPTGGWSTLGWFRDPILSNMLRRSEGQLAELLIHELTHATLYLPGSVDYNENFATFVGEQGAFRFLSSHFGADSPELKHYRELQEDEAVFGQHMLSACRRLDSLYNTLDATTSIEEKYKKKYRLIADIFREVAKLPLHHPEKYLLKKEEKRLPNNAFFMSYSRYRKKQDDFYRQYRETGEDLRKFIEWQRKHASN